MSRHILHVRQCASNPYLWDLLPPITPVGFPTRSHTQPPFPPCFSQRRHSKLDADQVSATASHNQQLSQACGLQIAMLVALHVLYAALGFLEPPQGDDTDPHPHFAHHSWFASVFSLHQVHNDSYCYTGL